jgi:hypothetical protein
MKMLLTLCFRITEPERRITISVSSTLPMADENAEAEGAAI